METLNTFAHFTSTIETSTNYKKALTTLSEQHNLKKYKITNITPEDALVMYRTIVEKFYKGYGPCESGTWFENELRLYLWTLGCYMQANRKQLPQMQDSDWSFFANLFYVKDSNLFEYQARSLLSDSKQRWQPAEDLMLYNIIMSDATAKWNEIAKTLFVLSGKKYLRTPKQCRERWLNHLDPNKTKSEWNIKQYQILFQQVLKKGKKWALVVKSLNDRRSQHSIKNKYNSIMRKQTKLTPDLNQNQICKLLLQKIVKMAESCQLIGNEEYLFGNANKFIGLNTKCKDNIHKIIIKKTEEEEIEESKKKFQSFRKKLTNIQFNQAETSQPKSRQPKRHNNKLKKQTLEDISIMVSPFKIKDKETSHENIPQKGRQVQRQEIFYEDSFESSIIQPQQNHLIFTEDLKNLIKQCDL